MFRARLFAATISRSRRLLQFSTRERFVRPFILSSEHTYEAHFRRASLALRFHSSISGRDGTFAVSAKTDGQPEGEPPLSPSTNPKLFMVFTCMNCETRAVKSFSKRAYEKGVVLVQCPGCQKRHVVADHLGWFGEHKNVEEILRAKGESVRRITDADLEDLQVVEGSVKPGVPNDSN